MIIYPAIDLKDGKCVRLTKGDFNQETIYSRSPLEQAKVFEQKGFQYLHVVDLDRTIDKSKSNLSTIKSIIQNTKLKVQVGGGLRTRQTVEEVIDLGVENVVMGTGAVNNPDLLLEVSQQYQNKISVGLDVREKMIALKGWKDQTEISCFDFLETIKNLPLRSIIFTDINKDGMKQSPNFEDTSKIAAKSNCPVIISGGVSSIDDIKKAKGLKNIEGIIVGKAIYDGDIKLDELIKEDA